MIISKHNTKIANILLAVALALTIALGVFFSQPVFAYAPMPVYSGSGTPSAQYMVDNGYLVSTRPTAGRTENFYLVSGTSDIRLGWVEKSGLCLYSPSQGNGWQFYSYSDGTSSGPSSFSLGAHRNGFYYTYILNSGFKDYVNSDIPVYSSLDELFGSESIVTNPSYERTITVKPGYIAYCLTDGGSVDLTAQFQNYSKFSRPLWDNAVRVSNAVTELPYGGVTFSSSFGQAVDWLKPSTAPTNFLGQTKIGGASYSDLISNNYFVIYNPTYTSVDENSGSYGRATVGPTITAHFTNLGAVVQYPLKTSATISYTSGSAIESGSDSDYSDKYIYIPEEGQTTIVGDTDYVSDISGVTGSAVNIPVGGSNIIPTTDDSNGTVGGLLHRIYSLLSAPVEHIQNLFNAGLTFFGFLASLWSWIPDEISTILVAAVAVLLVIGVIKVLWK